MDLQYETEQIVRVGLLLEPQKYGYPIIPIYNATLDWFWWRYLIKADGTVTDILTRTWTDVPSCSGIYFLTLMAYDTDQLGPLEIYIHDSVSLGKPIFMRFNVISPNAWEFKFGNQLAVIDSQHAQKG